MRHFSRCSNANSVFEDVGNSMGQSREKVISGLLSLVVAEWAAVTFLNLELIGSWMETELKVDRVSSKCIVIN